MQILSSWLVRSYGRTYAALVCGTSAVLDCAGRRHGCEPSMDIRSPIAHAHDALREHRVPRVRRLTRMARMAVTSARRDTRHKMACRQTSCCNGLHGGVPVACAHVDTQT